MRVLYDISLLGHSDRTGIFRTVYEIAVGLAKSNQCDLRFCAFDELWAWHRATEFVRCSAQLCSVPTLPVSASQKVRAQLVIFRHHLCGKRDRSIPVRALRRALVLAEGPVVYSDPIGDADIYHSGVLGIPEVVSRVRDTEAFLTVHDLLPVTKPDWFRHNVSNVLRGIISSHRPKGWYFCPSRATRNDLLNYRKDVDPERVFVIPWAASDIFAPCSDPVRLRTARARVGLPDDAQYFLSVCTLEPRKNLAHTLRCFGRVLRETGARNLYMVLVGVGGWKYDPVLETISADAQLRSRTLVAGYVEDDLLPALYSGCLAFFYISLYEGFGLPPLEAMNCGSPVVTSNTSSLPEVVSDAGIMVNPTDVDSLCEAMLRVYGSSELRMEMSRRSLARAREFSWARTVSETLHAYRVALGESTPYESAAVCQ